MTAKNAHDMQRAGLQNPRTRLLQRKLAATGADIIPNGRDQRTEEATRRRGGRNKKTGPESGYSLGAAQLLAEEVGRPVGDGLGPGYLFWVKTARPDRPELQHTQVVHASAEG